MGLSPFSLEGSKAMELITLIITGLGAGFFFAWSVTVIPGTKEVSDSVYLEAMQSINNKIINPVFFFIFFGPGLLLVYQATGLEPINILAASSYILGAIGITIVKNVPMNNKIESTDLSKLSDQEKTELRSWYEPIWNRWHYIRTGFSVLAFVLIAIK